MGRVEYPQSATQRGWSKKGGSRIGWGVYYFDSTIYFGKSSKSRRRRSMLGYVDSTRRRRMLTPPSILGRWIVVVRGVEVGICNPPPLGCLCDTSSVRPRDTPRAQKRLCARKHTDTHLHMGSCPLCYGPILGRLEGGEPRAHNHSFRQRPGFGGGVLVEPLSPRQCLSHLHSGLLAVLSYFSAPINKSQFYNHYITPAL